MNYNQYLADLFSDLDHHTAEWAGRRELCVTFTIDAKQWSDTRKQNGLGQLYGVDLSNFLSRNGILNEYTMPIVNDKMRAKNGFKRISVRYRLAERPRAPKLKLVVGGAS